MKISNIGFFGASLFAILLSLIWEYVIYIWFGLDKIFLIIIFSVLFILFNYMFCLIYNKLFTKEEDQEMKVKNRTEKEERQK